MVTRRQRAALALAFALVQLAAALPFSGGTFIDEFSDGSDRADALLVSGGNATVANLSVPLSAVVLDGSLAVSTLAGAGAPLAPAVDIGADGTAEWRFEGRGFGPFGAQAVFSDDNRSGEFNFPAPGNATARVLLPGNATVTAASLDIEGFSGQRWWNASWRGRLPISVKELAGRNQTDFVVETLLDTRNWTLSSAEREFRVTRVNRTTLEEVEVPLQVVDEINNGTRCFEAALVFAVQNLSAGATEKFHLYFNNPGAARSSLYSDFCPRLIQNRLSGSAGPASFLGPVKGPAGGSFDAGGNYWVADAGRHAVFGYCGTLGRPDDPGSDDSRLRSPIDAVARPDGKIIVVDRENHRIQLFCPNGTVAFTLGTAGTPGSDNYNFSSPGGAATDADGNIYVSDTMNHRVLVYDPNGTHIATIGATGSPGSDNAHFNAPSGLAVSQSKDVLVADLGNQRVQSFKYNGAGWGWNYTLGATGVRGSDNAHFDSPVDVSLDATGKAYIVDMANFRVQVFSGTFYRATLGVTGLGGLDSWLLNAPLGVAVSPSGRIFVSDTGAGRVQVFDASYRYVQSLGNRSAAFSVGAGTTDGTFNTPGGVSSDGSGRVYVSDTMNHRVLVYSALGDLLMTLGSAGNPGSDMSHFLYPRGLDVAPDGRLLVADGGGYPPGSVTSNNRVLVFSDLRDGAADAQIGVTGASGNTSTNLNQPWDVSANSNGKVAVADKGFMLGGMPPLVRGSRVQLFFGLADNSSDYTFGVAGLTGMSDTVLSFPGGVDETEAGWTFVADTGNNRVVLFKNDGNGIIDVALNPSGTAGSGMNQFRTPADLDTDGNGNIYVADTGNHRVSVFDANGSFLYAIGEAGSSLPDDRHLNRPAGVKAAGDGKVLVADTGNHRVVRVVPASLSVGPAEALAAPERVLLDVGGDGTADWGQGGFLAGKAAVPGLAAAFGRALRDLPPAVDAFGNAMVAVTINLSNAGGGRITLSNLSVMYECTAAVPGLAQAVRDYMLAHASGADASGNVSVPVLFLAASAGGVRLGDLRLAVDEAPRLVSEIPDRSLDEDTAEPALYDFSDHFQDDIDMSLNYTLVNLTNSTLACVTLVNRSVLSVELTVPSARNWNGAIEFRVKAQDSRNLSALSGRVTVTVRSVNDAPVFSGPPPALWARVGTEWSYAGCATDVDGDALRFILETRPGAMAVNSSSGRVAWTPSAADVGPHQVGLRVTDGFLSAWQNFTLNVTAAGTTNRPPVITSTPVTVAETAKPYSYQVVARDDDGDRLAYSLDEAPEGMAIGNGSGLVEWTPLPSQEGRHPVVVRVSDALESVTQHFNLTVSGNIAGLLPVVNITSPAAGKVVRGTVLLRGTASVPNGTIDAVEVQVDLEGGWVPATGKSSWAYHLDTTKLKNGRHVVFVRARDSAGNFGQANLTLDVQNAAAPAPAANNILGLPVWLFIAIVVAIVAASAAASAFYIVSRRKKAPAPPSAGAPAAAPPGAYTMTPPPGPVSQFQGAPPSGSPAAPVAGGPPAHPFAQAPVQISAAPVAAYLPQPPMATAPSPGPSQPAKAVDSVFLIYHDGRLITYFSKSESIKLDDTLDMIRKFVRASFSGQLGRLDSMRYENMNIIMERGNLMYMVVITPASETDPVRREMRLLLEEINDQYRVVFKIWDGDFNKVKGVKTMVEAFVNEEAGPASPARPGSGPVSPLHAPPPYSPAQAPSPASRPPSPPPSSQAPPLPPAPSQTPASSLPIPPPPPEPVRQPEPAKSSVQPQAAPSPQAPEPEARPPAKVRGLLDEEDEEEEPPGDIEGPEEPAPKIAPVVVSREEPLPLPPPPPPPSGPPPKTAAAAGLTDKERLELLEDRFLRGEITELTYRELRDKLGKK